MKYLRIISLRSVLQRHFLAMLWLLESRLVLEQVRLPQPLALLRLQQERQA
jgi:hypothetical protein